MKILTSQECFNKAKSRDLIDLECIICKKNIKRTKNIVVHHLKLIDEKRSLLRGSFCSNKCHGIYHTTVQKVSCKQCGYEFSRKLCEIKKARNNFCSHSCSVTYYNAHRTHGTKRSKLEFWIEEKISKLYPFLEVKYNSILIGKCELDIYIPSLELAFELNGIFHYEPIYGNDKLLKTQTNDNRKYKHCIDMGISLCVIDISSQKYFKESSSEKFLNIVTNIIDEKLESQGLRMPLPG